MSNRAPEEPRQAAAPLTAAGRRAPCRRRCRRAGEVMNLNGRAAAARSAAARRRLALLLRHLRVAGSGARRRPPVAEREAAETRRGAGVVNLHRRARRRQSESRTRVAAPAASPHPCRTQLDAAASTRGRLRRAPPASTCALDLQAECEPCTRRGLRRSRRAAAASLEHTSATARTAGRPRAATRRGGCTSAPISTRGRRRRRRGDAPPHLLPSSPAGRAGELQRPRADRQRAPTSAALQRVLGDDGHAYRHRRRTARRAGERHRELCPTPSATAHHAASRADSPPLPFARRAPPPPDRGSSETHRPDGPPTEQR